MKVIAINGSPRMAKWNTVTLLENALEGAKSAGASTELVHLYSLRFSGCISCFGCKALNRKKDAVCIIRDELEPVLARLRRADAIIVGTPLYFLCETAATRAFLERLCFPCLKYSKDMLSTFPRKIKTGLIYTMGASYESANKLGFDRIFETTRNTMARTFGHCELLTIADTLQYPDYDKYESELFDKDAKLKRHSEIFTKDCQRAFELGARLVGNIVLDGDL